MAETPPPAKNSARLEREKRLAEALRVNLKRRKLAAKLAAAEQKPAPKRPAGGP